MEDFVVFGQLVPPGLPTIRFLFVEPRLYSTLPSDGRLTVPPLRFANPSPPSSWIRDLHPQVVKHAWQTKKSRRGRTPEGIRPRRLTHQRAPRHGRVALYLDVRFVS